MAVTGSFGLPGPQKTSPQRSGGFPSVLLLVVSVNSGGFHKESPLAAGIASTELELYLGEWLKVPGNREKYVGSKIIPAPFVTPTE